MEEYYLGWAVLALINTALANADGRSPFAYLIGSAFFGPLVTFVLATTQYSDEGGTTFVSLIYGRNNRPAPPNSFTKLACRNHIF